MDLASRFRRFTLALSFWNGWKCIQQAVVHWQKTLQRSERTKSYLGHQNPRLYRGYYMPARGYEFYLRVFNSISHRVEHEKIKFVSTSGHVIFCLLYKQQNQGYFSNFPKISEHFPKISENFSKFSEQCPKFIRTFPIISRKFLKLSEDFRRLPKVAECFRAIVEDVSIR